MLLKIVKKLVTTSAQKNMISAYMAFISRTVCSIITVPVVVYYLSKEELGMWAIVSHVISYLAWMDFGIGPATGRMMAPAIYEKNQPEINRWWTSSLLVLCLLALVVIFIGWLLSGFFLGFFDFPESKLSEVRSLYYGSVMIASLYLPLRLFPGILTAQNQFHWVSVFQGVQPALHLLCMTVFLMSGFGVKSFVYSSLLIVAFGICYYNFLIRRNGNVFNFDFSGVTKNRLKTLVTFSSSVCVISFATAAVASVPVFLVGRVFGIEATAVFSFTSKIPTISRSLIGRTQQAYYPQLQKLYIEKSLDKFKLVYKKSIRLALAMAAVVSISLVAFNRSILSVLANDEYFGGYELTAAILIALIFRSVFSAQIDILRYTATMKKMPVVAILEVVAATGGGILGGHYFGITGVVVGSLVGSALTIGLYSYTEGPKQCGIGSWELCGESIKLSVIITVLIAMIGIFLSRDAVVDGWMPTWQEILSFTGGGVLALFLLKSVFLEIYNEKIKKLLTAN